MDNKEDVITFKVIENTEEIYNEDKTLLLTLRSKSDGNLPKIFNYQVLETKSKKILKDSVFTGMKLVWHTKKQLKGYLFVGMAENENDDTLRDDSNNKKTNRNIIIIDIK